MSENPSKQSNEQKRPRWRPTRRGFLIGLGVLGGGLAIGVPLGLPTLRLTAARFLDSASSPGPSDTDPFAWFEVTPESRLRLYLAKVEMGQGIHTALAQIGAEELGLAVADLEVVQASTHTGPNDSFGTAGSSSVSGVYDALRQTAATLRQLLQDEAAVALSVAPADLAIQRTGFAVSGQPEKAIEFAPLVARKSTWEIPDELPPVKAVADFQVIGTSAPRLDIPAKVNGQAAYGYDMRLEGMLYGAVARPPRIEAKLTSAAEGTALSVPGVKQVVIKDDFVGVVATSRAAARLGVNALALTWDEGKAWQQAEIDALVAIGDGGGVRVQKEGNAGRALAGGATVSADYFTPLAAHTSMEPPAALAHVTPEKVTVWASVQSQSSTQSDVAEALGVDAETVEVIPTFLGGGFGRKSFSEPGREAAILSQAVGAPVHVGWDRTEDLRHGFFRPPVRNQLSAVLDANGKIEAIQHKQASGDVLFAFFPAAAAAVLGADFGAWRGSTIHYGGIANRETLAWRAKVPVRTASWRGLGLLPNAFAVETFMDELAHSAGQDPLAFRLAHLGEDEGDRRMAAVLQAAADKAGWGTPLPDGRARGIACCTDVDTKVAQVAEVSVENGRIRVHKITAAMDCGLVINPDGAAAQVQGNVMWGVGSALIESVKIQDGAVVAGNFDGYPLLTMRESPDVEVILLDGGDGRPRGVGEPAIGPVAPAIGNAVFALTGQRLRRLPFQLG
jgi:isoquinoline 1-oxidoreductase beta subunit